MSNQKVWYWHTFYFYRHGLPIDLHYANTGDYFEYRRLYDLDSKKTKQEKQIFDEIYHKRIKLREMARSSFLPLPQEHMPDIMYAGKNLFIGKKLRKNFKLPEIFLTGVFVSQQKFVDILKQFRLGQTQIGQPIRIFDLDTDDYFDDVRYYFINIAERHRYFLPDQQKTPKYKHYCADNYPISSKALDCPVDIWHDPAIKNSLFLSDNLAQALLQSDIDKNLLEFWECSLVEPQD